MAITVTLAVKGNVGVLDGSAVSTIAFAVGDVVDFLLHWTSPGDEVPTTLTDNLGNTYVEKATCRVRDAGNGQSMTVYAAKVTNAGTPTISWAWPGGSGRANVGYTMAKLTGADVTGTPPASGNALAQAGVGTGANAAATETVTPAGAGDCVLGSIQDVSVGSVTLTKKASATALSNTGAADGCGTQYELVASGAAYAATWTLSATRDVISAVRSYTIAGGGSDTLTIDDQPTTGTSGVALDDFDLSSSDGASTATITATIKTGSGALSGTDEVAMTAGAATFSNLIITGSGDHTLAFNAPGHDEVVSATITISGGSGPSVGAVAQYRRNQLLTE